MQYLLKSDRAVDSLFQMQNFLQKWLYFLNICLPLCSFQIKRYWRQNTDIIHFTCFSVKFHAILSIFRVTTWNEVPEIVVAKKVFSNVVAIQKYADITQLRLISNIAPSRQLRMKLFIFRIGL